MAKYGGLNTDLSIQGQCTKGNSAVPFSLFSEDYALIGHSNFLVLNVSKTKELVIDLRNIKRDVSAVYGKGQAIGTCPVIHVPGCPHGQ